MLREGCTAPRNKFWVIVKEASFWCCHVLPSLLDVMRQFHILVLGAPGFNTRSALQLCSMCECQ